jgi:hypothetical protein
MLLMLVLLGLAHAWTCAPRSPSQRGPVCAGSTLRNFAAVSRLPLAEEHDRFQSPLLVTVFGGRRWRERVAWDRWMAVLVGFAGTPSSSGRAAQCRAGGHFALGAPKAA